MNRKMIITAAAVLPAVIAVSIIIGVIQGKNIQKSEVELYFLNDTESTLVSEKRVVKYRDSYDLEAAVVEQLIKGPENGKNKPVINRKTKLNYVDLTNPSEIIVDFNYKFLRGDSTKDVLSTYAVVKTLCGIDGIEKVKVTVEKNDIPTAEGKPIGFLSDADINLSTDTNTGETKEVTLYFADKQTNKLAAETRNIKVTDQLPLAQYVISELIRGASESGHNNVLSPDTILIGVTITDNICFVNFDESFITKNSGSENKEKLAVYSIVNSLTEFNTIGRVQFLINGKKVEKFGEILFDGLFERNINNY